MAAKFTPIPKAKKDKDGNPILDKDGKEELIDLYKGTTFEEMVDFLIENGTDKDRAEFKKNCYQIAKRVPTGRKDKNGKEIMEVVKDSKGNEIMENTNKINWLYAKKKFFEKYAPEYITAKKKVSKASLIKDW